MPKGVRVRISLGVPNFNSPVAQLAEAAFSKGANGVGSSPTRATNFRINMKKYILGSLLLFSAPIYAQDTFFGEWDDLFSKFGSSGPTIKAYRFKIDAPGTDMRGYAFTHPQDENIKCVFVAGTGKGGLSCVRVK